VAAYLEDRYGLLVELLKQEEPAWRLFHDLNTQMLPPAYRSLQTKGSPRPQRGEGWMALARKAQAGCLIEGSFEQYGGVLRYWANGMDPFTSKAIFSCQVEGATEERLALEDRLAQQVASRIKAGADRPRIPVAIPKDGLEALVVANVTAETPLTADEHYENGFALTRRYDQTGETKYLDGALEEYRAALALDPNHFRSLNNLGTVLHRSGRHEEALQYYLKVLELNPKYARAMENAALAYRSLGKVNEATSMWERALEVEDREEVRKVIEETLRNVKGAEP
jgi:tetratricopeptide (TPR) repeat protein